MGGSSVDVGKPPPSTTTASRCFKIESGISSGLLYRDLSIRLSMSLLSPPKKDRMIQMPTKETNPKTTNTMNRKETAGGCTFGPFRIWRLVRAMLKVMCVEGASLVGVWL